MKSDLVMAVNQICAEKELPRDVILGAIEEALVHAYRRNYANNNAVVQVKIDGATGDLRVLSLYAAQPASAGTQTFLDFVQSPAGQAIIGRHMTPVRK